MLGWGARLLGIGFGLGLASVAGCGGRTDTLDDLYGDEGGSSGSGGSSAGTGGAGASPQGGTRPMGGTRAVGGSAPLAGRGGGATGGVGPLGGSSFGGVGGTVVGGVGGVGAFSGGGFGAVGGTSPLDCQTCLTLACTPQLAQCFQDPGCIAIFGCVATTGCNTLECYTPMYCKNIIDQFGGPTGSSMSQVLDVVGCAINSGCDCQ